MGLKIGSHNAPFQEGRKHEHSAFRSVSFWLIDLWKIFRTQESVVNSFSEGANPDDEHESQENSSTTCFTANMVKIGRLFEEKSFCVHRQPRMTLLELPSPRSNNYVEHNWTSSHAPERSVSISAHSSPWFRKFFFVICEENFLKRTTDFGVKEKNLLYPHWRPLR